MDTNNWIQINCLELIQPIGTFYVGKISWQDLLNISYSEKRRILDEESNKEDSYFGIQRELSDKRLKEISQYVTYQDATFPSSIVLAISSVTKIDEENEIINIEYDESKKILKIRNDHKIAHIIDGQHRIFGLEKYKIDNPLIASTLNFELLVSIFIDIDDDNQSMIFATINKAQTKVNKSLVYDLFELAKTKSPQRTAHNIVKLLDEENGSPLKGMINRLGRANDPLRETITQATLVESFIKYISSNPMRDRDLLRKGKKISLADDQEIKKRFFRNWFLNDEDVRIAKVIWNYFSAIKKHWPLAWGTTILSKSTGVIAFMKFLSPLINYLGTNKDITEDDFFKVISKIDIKDGIGYASDFNTNKYVPGVKGQSKLYKELLSKSGLKSND
jgi:DGQHR domain-containing protein